MPVETLRPSNGRMAGAPFASAMPFRILNKGPEYFRRPPDPGARKLSAVERLEADKAKYVKSQQVATTRQEPVKPPIIRKPLLSPGAMLQCRINSPPARKVPRRPGDGEGGFGAARRGTPLNLEILNNLINVCDTPSPSSSSPSSLSVSAAGKSKLRNGNASSPSPASSSPLARLPLDEQNQRPPPVPARTYGSPNTVTVRRVDVRPQAEARKPLRTPPKRQVAQPQVPPQTRPPTSPLLLPPPSPAFTRLSSASSGRRHGPSLHRSKSDLSDRYSRATADLERFFNYCGLDPEEAAGLGVEHFARASSDIVSVSRLRSVSTPSSERGPAGGQEEEPAGVERAPYGISVIERNARVIKWLYGIRQARDAHSVSDV